jgi:small GTP-binding protein
MADSKQLSKKIVLLGDPSVGKTSVVRKFVLDMFDDKYISTLGTKVSKKQIVYEFLFKDKKINLTLLIWDVMGQRDFARFHQVAFTGCKGALVVSDITRYETIENLSYWQKSLYKSAGEIPIVFIGNKNDLSRFHKSGIDKFYELTHQLDFPSFLTSAKTGENVGEAFYLLGENMLKFDFEK